jgi:Putative restriction endonuclease
MFFENPKPEWKQEFVAHIDQIPDLAVEIVSPSNVGKKWEDNLAFYHEAGFPEFWLVQVEDRSKTNCPTNEHLKKLLFAKTLRMIELPGSEFERGASGTPGPVVLRQVCLVSFGFPTLTTDRIPAARISID